MDASPSGERAGDPYRRSLQRDKWREWSGRRENGGELEKTLHPIASPRSNWPDHPLKLKTHNKKTPNRHEKTSARGKPRGADRRKPERSVSTLGSACDPAFRSAAGAWRREDAAEAWRREHAAEGWRRPVARTRFVSGWGIRASSRGGVLGLRLGGAGFEGATRGRPGRSGRSLGAAPPRHAPQARLTKGDLTLELKKERSY